MTYKYDENIVTIFIPKKLRDIQYGYLTGILFEDEQKSESSMIVIDDQIQEQLDDAKELVGMIHYHSNRYGTEPSDNSLWLIVVTSPQLCIKSLTIHGQKVNSGNINLVFYNSLDIQNSVLFPELPNEAVCHCSSKCVYYFIKRVKMSLLKPREPRSHILNNRLLNLILNLFTFLLLYLISVLLYVNTLLMKRFEAQSCFILQVILRFKQIEKCLKNIFKSSGDLMGKRLVGVILFDILLGLFHFYLINKWTSADELHSYFQSSTKVVAKCVQDLLGWLRGAPAGLKLNQPLTEALASFFSYHVYLWTLYLDVSSPILAVLSRLFVYLGLFGISLQVALLVDFLNLAVLHIHCFYIYAARLHMVLMSLLGSQWRGFRGRKWNPLKERVDSKGEGSHRPLIKILSAVGFTLIVFVLPTTIVYYAVFVTLRVCLLSLHGFTSLLLWSLNFNPVYIIWLYILGSPTVKGELHFELDFNEKKTSSPPLLHLSVQSSPFHKVIAASDSEDVFPPFPKPNISYIWKSLIYAKELL